MLIRHRQPPFISMPHIPLIFHVILCVNFDGMMKIDGDKLKEEGMPKMRMRKKKMRRRRKRKKKLKEKPKGKRKKQPQRNRRQMVRNNNKSLYQHVMLDGL